MNTATKVCLCVGKIEQVLPFPKARNPSYKVQVLFGQNKETDTRWTSAQLSLTYPNMNELVGRNILGIINFPKKNVAGFSSEFLLTGLPGKHDHHVRLANFFEVAIDPGTTFLGWPENTVTISWDDFTKAEFQIAQWIAYDSSSRIAKVTVIFREMVQIQVPYQLFIIPKQGDKVIVFPLCNSKDSSWGLLCCSNSKSESDKYAIPVGVDDQDNVEIGSRLY